MTQAIVEVSDLGMVMVNPSLLYHMTESVQPELAEAGRLLVAMAERIEAQMATADYNEVEL